MAHLEVEPKPSRPLWIWILLAIILIALAATLFKQCNGEPAPVADTTVDSTTVATTVPDWKSVDFTAAPSSDKDISDADIQTRNGETYTIYTLAENILFPSDGNAISPTGEAKLNLISDVLKKRFEGATIGVFGSTDSIGPAQENKELGMQRAEAVKDWLALNGNVPIETISVQSLGEAEPVATNQTTDGRKKNRNVSIVIFPK